MKKILYSLLVLPLIFCATSLFACDGHKDASTCPEHSFLLPLDVTDVRNRICNLSVTVPSKYRSVKSTKGVYTQSEKIEFIPLNESTEYYTELITIDPHIGKKVEAQSYLSQLIDEYSEKYNASVLFHEVSSQDKPGEMYIAKVRNGKQDLKTMHKHENKEFGECLCILKYQIDGNEELIGFKYVSGPYDCGGIQYRFKIGKGISEDYAYKQIVEFLHNESYILDLRKILTCTHH